MIPPAIMFLARDQARVESCDHGIYHQRSQDNECSDPRHIPIKLIIDGALLTPVTALLTCAQHCCKERNIGKPWETRHYGEHWHVTAGVSGMSHAKFWRGQPVLKKVTFKQCRGSRLLPLKTHAACSYGSEHKFWHGSFRGDPYYGSGVLT